MVTSAIRARAAPMCFGAIRGRLLTLDAYVIYNSLGVTLIGILRGGWTVF